jgi:hypothetical protein
MSCVRPELTVLSDQQLDTATLLQGCFECLWFAENGNDAG